MELTPSRSKTPERNALHSLEFAAGQTLFLLKILNMPDDIYVRIKYLILCEGQNELWRTD